jgi:rhodanese-related sulfurtransferase
MAYGDAAQSCLACEPLLHRHQRAMTRILTSLVLLAVFLTAPVRAADLAPVAKAIEEYMDFSEYGSSVIWPEQIPEEDWKRISIIDARSADQYAKAHIPGAVNIDWRQIPARRDEITKDGLVVIYCNTGSLSAQSVFAMRLLGWDNVKVLQNGIEGWEAKGGFEANKRASKAAGH